MPSRARSRSHCSPWSGAAAGEAPLASAKGKLGLAAGVLALGVGVWMAVDAWVVTDAERLERFVDAATGTVTPGRIDRALSSWVDLEQQPLEVDVRGRRHAYGAEESAALRKNAHARLRRLRGNDLRLLGESIEIHDGGRAEVALRLLVGRSMVDVDFRFRRHGDRWLVSRVRVR